MPTGTYSISFKLTYNDCQDGHLFAFDNFSLKKMCGACQAYPGRPSNRIAKEEEPITKLSTQGELYQSDIVYSPICK